MTLEANKEWLDLTENLVRHHNLPLSPAHNQVLIRDYTLSMEKGFFEDTNIDAQIAQELADAITQNTNLDSPLSGKLYLSYIKMLKAGSYFYLTSTHSNADPDGVTVANNLLQGGSSQDIIEMQKYLDSRLFQTLSYKYVDLIIPLIEGDQIESHFYDIDHIPLELAAQRTGLSKSRISRLSTTGTIDGVRPGGHLRFVSLSSINNYIENRVWGGVGIKVPEQIQIDEKHYSLVNTVSSQFDVVENWIVTLLRRGIVDGVQPKEYRGRWYVDLDSLREYFKNN